MADNSRDDHFRHFGLALNGEISDYGAPAESFFLRQKEQVEGLVQLESDFRETLIAHEWGAAVYQEFITYICEGRRNILDARPYFREPKDTFTAGITPALKEKNGPGLYPFAGNFRFIAWVMKAREWTDGDPISELYKKIRDLRHEIVVLNTPLGITRARIFLKHARNWTFMDLIQISIEGIMSAVDKYMLPFSGTFVSTLLGYIHGYLIERCQETTLHFYPGDKRKLYRANKLASKMAGDIDFELLAERVNEKYIKQHTDAAEMSDLMTSAVCVSLDVGPTDGGEHNGNSALTGAWAVAPDSARPDVQAEANEAIANLKTAVSQLTLYERKLLRLRGVEMASFAIATV